MCEVNHIVKTIVNSTRRCAVVGCDTCAGMGIPVHRFPREEIMLHKWIDATGVKSVSLSTIICGLHFKVSDYFNLSAQKRRLKADAIPNLHLTHDHINDCDYEDDDEEIKYSEPELENPEVELDDIGKLELLKDQENVPVIDSIMLTLIEKNVNKETQTCDSQSNIDRSTQTTHTLADASTQTNCTGAYNFMELLQADANLHAFTGLNHQVLSALEKCINLLLNKSTDHHQCSLKERIVLTVCKLRLNLSYTCLGILFRISASTACNYFGETLHLLAVVLEEAIYFPSKEEIGENMPTHFENFQDTRIVLDCTEVPVQNSKCLQCRLKMYSYYKGGQTVKVMIGVTPSGLISYCSKCFGGRASDKAIVMKTGILDKLISGEDAVMVDKGFLIREECEKRQIKLYRPPFASSEQQMSTDDSCLTKSIASARVHVERAIQRMKIYNILKFKMDWEMTKHVDNIFTVVCGLVNLSSPILDKVRFSR